MNNESKGNKKGKKRFNLFDWYYRQGKESNKADINALKDPSIVNYFKLVWFKLGKLFSANLIFVFGNFPIFFFLLGISQFFDKSSYAPAYTTWGPFQSILADSMGNGDYVSSALIGIYGMHNDTSYKSIFSIILIALSVLLIFTWGITKVGTTYVYRNMMSGDAIFPLSDSLYIVKRNKKQSFIIGAIDIILLAMLVFGIYILLQDASNPLSLFMLFLNAIMLLLYFMMRPYIYIMVFTFDLKITQIFKNATFFTILGIKRNLLMLLGSALLIAFNIGLLFIPFITPVALILPLIITFALLDFMGVYAAYPNIIKYMMDEKDAKRVIERLQLDDEEPFDEDIDSTIQEQE
ncbi:MAG: hypothetical protein IJ437_02485 [Clostridia bacterium]|nr:hypothetical protein [Clostridia bacterium]